MDRALLRQEIDGMVKELLSLPGVNEVCLYGSALPYLRGESEKLPRDIDLWVWADENMPDDIAMKIIEDYPERFDIKLADDTGAIPSMVAFVDRYTFDDQRFMSEDAFMGMECYANLQSAV